ncbi:MAG: SxtJ family membrane protein [Candidatus Polarisedimenticolia bacterium]
MKRALRHLYRGWMAFAHGLGVVQTFLILSIIYVVGIGIVGPLYRLFAGDPLDRSFRRPGSAWAPKPPANATLEDARRMF